MMSAAEEEKVRLAAIAAERKAAWRARREAWIGRIEGMKWRSDAYNDTIDWHIILVVKRCDYNINRASAVLAITRAMVYRHIDAYIARCDADKHDKMKGNKNEHN